LRKYTKTDIARAVTHLFPDEDSGEIIGMLESYGSGNYENEVHRVRLGVLKLSQGRKDKLVQMIKLAKTDYRDILFAAEYTQPGDKLIDDPYGGILQDSGANTSSSE
jgi:hypothetical protein